MNCFEVSKRSIFIGIFHLLVVTPISTDERRYSPSDTALSEGSFPIDCSYILFTYCC